MVSQKEPYRAAQLDVNHDCFKKFYPRVFLFLVPEHYPVHFTGEDSPHEYGRFINFIDHREAYFQTIKNKIDQAAANKYESRKYQSSIHNSLDTIYHSGRAYCTHEPAWIRSNNDNLKVKWLIKHFASNFFLLDPLEPSPKPLFIQKVKELTKSSPIRLAKKNFVYQLSFRYRELKATRLSSLNYDIVTRKIKPDSYYTERAELRTLQKIKENDNNVLLLSFFENPQNQDVKVKFLDFNQHRGNHFMTTFQLAARKWYSQPEDKKIFITTQLDEGINLLLTEIPVEVGTNRRHKGTHSFDMLAELIRTEKEISLKLIIIQLEILGGALAFSPKAKQEIAILLGQLFNFENPKLFKGKVWIPERSFIENQKTKPWVIDLFQDSAMPYQIFDYTYLRSQRGLALMNWKQKKCWTPYMTRYGTIMLKKTTISSL
ncbi:MAG: hypothetical protein AAF770_03825 [Bacteroidota bacterium]